MKNSSKTAKQISSSVLAVFQQSASVLTDLLNCFRAVLQQAGPVLTDVLFLSCSWYRWKIKIHARKVVKRKLQALKEGGTEGCWRWGLGMSPGVSILQVRQNVISSWFYNTSNNWSENYVKKQINGVISERKHPVLSATNLQTIHVTCTVVFGVKTTTNKMFPSKSAHRTW